MQSIHKTTGIVLNSVPYNDKTHFVHIYTAHFGMTSYAVPQTKSKRAKLARALFAPLTVLQLEVEHKDSRSAQKILDAQVADVHYGLLSDPVKNAMTFFLAEFLDKVIQEHEANPTLFTYIKDSIALFDLIEEGKANFHLLFLVRLAPLLGFQLDDTHYSTSACFDLMEGRYVEALTDHAFCLLAEDATLLHSLLQTSFSSLHELKLHHTQRNRLLEILLAFYRLHLVDFPKINSLEVLQALF